MIFGVGVPVIPQFKFQPDSNHYNCMWHTFLKLHTQPPGLNPWEHLVLGQFILRLIIIISLESKEGLLIIYKYIHTFSQPCEC